MGNALDSFKPKPAKVFLTGLDAAGKTTLAYAIGSEPRLDVMCSWGPEQLMWRNINFFCWDLGGQEKIKVILRPFLTGTKGIAFVFDSTDKDQENIDLAKREVNWLISESDFKGLPLLVLANKQDLECASSVAEVAERLGLDEIVDRKWHIQGTTYKNKQSVIDGFDWLQKAMR